MNATSYAPGTTGGQKEWLDGMLTTLEPEATPFTSSLKKNYDAKGVYHETVADKLDGRKIMGSREGDSGPKGGNKASNRERFGSYLGRYVKSFGVTDVQQAVSQSGGVNGVDDEYARSKAKSITELKLDLEAAALSAVDGQSGGANEMRMRGAFKWLSNSQSPAVPANFQAPAAQRLTGVATLVESGSNSVNSVLQSLFTSCGVRKTYDVYCGVTYLGHFANFTRTGPETTTATRVVYDGESAKKIRLNVEVFDTPFGVLNLQPSLWLRATDDGQTGDATAMLIVDREFWSLDFLEALHAADDAADAGGMTGYVKAIGGLFCRMPKGNAFVYNS